MHRQHTYVFRSGGTAFYKVGRSNKILVRRGKLQAGNPYFLRIERVFEGDVEKELHELLAAHRVRGEWFFCPGLAAIVDDHAARRGYKELTKEWNT